MNIAVLGTGMVGVTIADKLIELGHEVVMGSRSADNEKGIEWATKAGPNARLGTFREAASKGAVIFNCTSGRNALDALRAAGAENLSGKLVLDLTNPLDFSQGFPPSLTVCNQDSLGEQIQKEFPEARVVKTLNTVNCKLMVDQSPLPEVTDMFICGNDDSAKLEATKILREWFGWQSVRDLGDISNARGLEAWLLMWVRLWNALGTADFNIKLVVGEKQA